MEKLRLYLVTYNVGTSNPDQDLTQLLRLNDKNDSLPDFYVLSFQEVKAQPQQMLMDTLFDDAWTFACKELLKKKGYIKLKSIRLQGLLLIVFGLKKHLLNIREIESEYTRTGFSGMWGNKGAVSIRFGIYGCSVCFVNSHLSAHDNQLKQRVDDYNNIVKDHEFHVEETSKIFYHDYVFWMGDLNFRLLEEYEKTPDEIERGIYKKELDEIFRHDQLQRVMKTGEAFSEFTETKPSFPPTFKFEVGTNSYDHKRRPAWCDRILYCVNEHNYENVVLNTTQNSYQCHPTYTLSDHKPVSGDFAIKIPHAVDLLAPSDHLAVKGPFTLHRIATDGAAFNTFDQIFSDYSECLVRFEKIVCWDGKEENKAYFKTSDKAPKTKEDWIGLFREDFCALDEYVSYEYVSKCATCTFRPGRHKQTDSDSPQLDRASSTDRPMIYEMRFSELPGRCSGNYCLVYFSQTEDKVCSVLGISNAFPVTYSESD